MKKIYAVYQLNEKKNKLGNPYIGFSNNIIRRSKEWKRNLKLDYVPNLVLLYFSTEETQAFEWEQNKKVEYGWNKEKCLSNLKTMHNKSHNAPRSAKQLENANELKKQGKINVESGHFNKIKHLAIEAAIKKNKESGKSKLLGEKWGPISGKKNVESGHWEKVIQLGTKKSHSAINTCLYCNKTIKGPNYFKWHGENCKSKPATRSTL
jgi:hypothetical protein